MPCEEEGSEGEGEEQRGSGRGGARGRGWLGRGGRGAGIEALAIHGGWRERVSQPTELLGRNLARGNDEMISVEFSSQALKLS